MSTELEDAAQAGNTFAQFRLALAHRAGDGVPQDDAAAARWFERAASQGHVTAQYNLAVAYMTGAGVAEDVDRAFGWFLRAATNPEPDADARYTVGCCLLDGVGTAQDIDRGLEFLVQAVGQRHVASALRLAQVHLDGVLVPKDLDVAARCAGNAALGGSQEGMELLTSLADAGFAPAQYVMSLVHITESAGFGVDLEKALAWARQAHDQGYTEADALFEQLEATERHLRALRQEAEAGDPSAQLRLGDVHREGVPGVPRDTALALEWFGKAAAQGSAEARTRLADMGHALAGDEGSTTRE